MQSSDCSEHIRLQIERDRKNILSRKEYFMRFQDTVFLIRFDLDNYITINLLNNKIDIPLRYDNTDPYFLVPEMNVLTSQQTTLANTRYKGLLVEDRNKEGLKNTWYQYGYFFYKREKYVYQVNGAEHCTESPIKNDVGNDMGLSLDLFPASGILACFNRSKPMPLLSKRDYIVIEAN